MTYELCCRQQNRNSLYKKVKLKTNDQNLRQRFDYYSLKLKNYIIYQKTNYYQNLFQKNKNNAKKQWQVINGVLGLKNVRNNIVSIEKIDGSGETIQDPLLKANEFDSFLLML